MTSHWPESADIRRLEQRTPYAIAATDEFGATVTYTIKLKPLVRSGGGVIVIP